MSFEPRILSFMCNWCCYAAADGAGVARQNYPPYHRVIRIMCSTRVDPLLVFEGFNAGADGILVGGCHLGECKYVDGNYLAVVMGEVVKSIMRVLRMDEQRFMIEWASAAEGNKLVEDLKKYFALIKSLGPLGEKENWTHEEKKLYLQASIELTRNMQFRATYGNICKELKKMGDFSEKTIRQKIDEKLTPIIKSKLYEFEIKELLKDGPKTIDYLVKKTKGDVQEIEKILNKLIKS